mmetsp:Transcript_22702/g.63830  ORF Transcript_22702/g.63830 Transcript_22702/m.63830 type:complete len:211 (+) Transcript_22702:176-808(+)
MVVVNKLLAQRLQLLPVLLHRRHVLRAVSPAVGRQLVAPLLPLAPAAPALLPHRLHNHRQETVLRVHRHYRLALLRGRWRHPHVPRRQRGWKLRGRPVLHELHRRRFVVGLGVLLDHGAPRREVRRGGVRRLPKPVVFTRQCFDNKYVRPVPVIHRTALQEDGSQHVTSFFLCLLVNIPVRHEPVFLQDEVASLPILAKVSLLHQQPFLH